MRKLRPFRAFLFEDETKRESRWWDWSPGSLKEKAKKYDIKVRRVCGLDDEETVPEHLCAIPTPPTSPMDDDDDLLNYPCISRVDRSALSPPPPETLWYRFKYSDVGMYFRYSILEPTADKLVDIVAGVFIAPFYLMIPLYYLVAIPLRVLDTIITKTSRGY